MAPQISPLKRLLDAEMPDLGPAWQPWVQGFYAVFGIFFPLFIVLAAFFHDNITLGPGLADEPQPLAMLALDQLSTIAERGQRWFLWIFVPLGVFALCFNGLMVYRGYTHFERELGRKLPLRDVATFSLLQTAGVALLIVSLAICGAIAAANGGSFAEGFGIVRRMTEYSQGVVARIPTLIELPYPLPLFASIIALDFFYYWFHRLGHTWRPFWLLWHRPHHLTPHLSVPTTQPVFAAAPLFLLVAIPFQVATGAIAKVFGPDSMVMEALLFRAVGQIPAIYAHNSAHYYRFQKNALLRFLGNLHGGGNYHYIHHSALPQHTLCNLGGTAMFYCWDRLFGTYHTPPTRQPPVGLTNSPAIHMNPLRLALAGMLQLGYELRMNDGWRERVRILLGPSSYTPPVTRDFAIKEHAPALRQNRQPTPESFPCTDTS